MFLDPNLINLLNNGGGGGEKRKQINYLVETRFVLFFSEACIVAAFHDVIFNVHNAFQYKHS